MTLDVVVLGSVLPLTLLFAAWSADSRYHRHGRTGVWMFHFSRCPVCGGY